MLYHTLPVWYRYCILAECRHNFRGFVVGLLYVLNLTIFRFFFWYEFNLRLNFLTNFFIKMNFIACPFSNCFEKFLVKKSWMDHLQFDHCKNNYDLLVCQVNDCKMSYSSIASYDRHLRRKHGDFLGRLRTIHEYFNTKAIAEMLRMTKYRTEERSMFFWKMLVNKCVPVLNVI